MKLHWLLLPLLGTGLILQSCGGGGGGSSDDFGVDHSRPLSEEEIAAEVAYEHPLAEAYYKEFPDFFRYATPEDLPADLTWEDGMDQPDIGSPDSIKGGTVNVWLPDYPRTLRFVGPDSSNSFRKFISDEHDMRVVQKHPMTGKYYPGTCNAWAFSEDRKTVYFKLDPDVRYSDGVPATADDYFFLFYFMRSEWLSAPWYANWYHEKYTHITKYDDHTIAVGLTEAKPDPLRFFEEDVYPLPRHGFKDFGEDFVQKYTWKFVPSTGPYVIHPEDIKKGSTLTQTRLEDWWAKDKKFWRYRYNPDKRVYRVIRDEDKALEAFLRGDFDVWPISVAEEWYDKLDTEAVNNGYVEKVQFYNQTPRPCYSLRLNNSKPPLDNRDVREGLQYATDFDLVIKEFFRGDDVRMQTSSDGYGEFTNPDIKARKFNVDKALECFARAGYDKRGPDGILVNENGDRLEFSVTTGYARYRDVLTILQQQARKAGVDLQPEVLERTTAWKKAQEKKHEIVLAAFNRSVEMYPRYFDFWHSYNAFSEDGSPKETTNNLTVTGNPEFDKVIDKYEASTDLEEIKQLAYQMEEMIYEDASFIPGWVRPYYRVAKWRWVKFPEGFDYRLSREHTEMNTYWIDPEIKEETLKAMDEGKTFEPVTRIVDQYRTDK